MVVLRGSPFDYPLFRSPKDKFFRLIDFGRSFRYYVSEEEKDRGYYERIQGWGNKESVHIPYRCRYPPECYNRTRMEEEEETIRRMIGDRAV